MPGIQHGRSLCSFIDGSFFCCICCCCFPIGSRFLAGNSSPAIKIFARIFRTKSLQQKNEMEQFSGIENKKNKAIKCCCLPFSQSLNTLNNIRSLLEIIYNMNIYIIYNMLHITIIYYSFRFIESALMCLKVLGILYCIILNNNIIIFTTGFYWINSIFCSFLSLKVLKMGTLLCKFIDNFLVLNKYCLVPPSIIETDQIGVY